MIIDSVKELYTILSNGKHNEHSLGPSLDVFLERRGGMR